MLDRLFEMYIELLGKKIITILVTLSLIDGVTWGVKHIYRWVETGIKYFL